MSAGDEADVLRSVTREVLAELLPGLLEEALTAQPAANGNGHPAVADEPAEAEPPAAGRPAGARAAGRGRAPPVRLAPAAGVRHDRPAAAGTRGGTGHAGGSGGCARSSGSTCAPMPTWTPSCARSCAGSRTRATGWRSARAGCGSAWVRSGRAPAPRPRPAPAMRIERGAVTERTVREAAAAGARLVLAPRAVLTPMARDRARSLGVEIEKERPC